jgi:hypothetical protein
MINVFLSHSSKDRAFARKLADELITNGINVWIDEAELRVGDSLIDKIGNAINKADFIAVILSPNSVSSNWVQKELALALSKEFASKKVKVLPILKEPCEIPHFLQDKLYADFTSPEDFVVPFSKLLRALGVAKPIVKSSEVVLKKSVATKKQKIKLFGKEVSIGNKLENFQDILLKAVNRDKTYKPDTSLALFNIYLELSSHPPREWVEIFEAERKFPRHTMWRRAWIEGKYIVINCVPDELNKYHIKDLKVDVTNSNKKYREYLHREAVINAKVMKQEEEDIDSLNNALDNLQL